MIYWSRVLRWDGYSKDLLHPNPPRSLFAPPLSLEAKAEIVPEPVHRNDTSYRSACVGICILYTLPLWLMLIVCVDWPRLLRP